jgi:TRAP-type C4-dicarboxylate transport system substrate-binding protein
VKLRNCVIKVAALALLAGLAAQASATDLKLATVAPEGSGWMKDLRAAAAQVRDRTGGRVNIKFYGGGIQGTDKKVLRKIRIGQLQGGVFTSNSVEERYPDIMVYGLPMLFNSQEEVDYVRQRMDARLTAGLDQAGFATYGFAGGGFAYLLTGKPVASLADLRGQKIWVPEGDQTSYTAMEALKLSPVVLPITDVLTGLETGLLDIVATPPVGAIILQWYTKTRYVTNLPLTYTIGFLAIDKGALKGVSAADQAVIREVMTALYARFDAQNRVDNAKAEQALRANGLKFVEPVAADVPRWRADVSAAMDAMAARGAFSASLLAEVRKLRDEFRKGRAAVPAAGQRP